MMCFFRGTDGSVFPPGVTRNDTLHIFNKQLCQSLPLVYQEDIEANGIPGYRQEM
jgi:scavenger receptor class B protein 1